jgi:hypothetical protein
VQEVDHRVQKDIHKNHAHEGNDTAGNQSEDLAKHRADTEKDEHIFPLSLEIGQKLGLDVKAVRMLGIGVDAVGLVELVEADGIDNQHDGVGYQGLDHLIVKLIEYSGDDDGAEYHSNKCDKDRQGYVQNTGTDGIIIFS